MDIDKELKRFGNVDTAPAGTIEVADENLDRPLKDAKPKLKKQSWRPAPVTEVSGKEPGWRYHQFRPDQIDQKQREGWVIVNSMNRGGDEASVGDGRLTDGSPVDSVVGVRNNLILMRMLEELAIQRDEYYENLNQANMKGAISKFKEDVTVDAENKESKTAAYGDIKISVGDVDD